MPHTLLAAFLRQTIERPHAMALRMETAGQPLDLTWQALAILVARVARKLEQRFRAESPEFRRLVYASQNRLSDVVLALACPACQVIEVPLDPRLGDASIHRLRDRTAGLWLDERECEQWIREALRPCDGKSTCEDGELAYLRVASGAIVPAGPALVLWTSGTTGSPKGVTLSHRNLVGNAAAKLSAVPQSPRDCRLTALPLCHAYARTCDFGTWLLSGCVLAITLGFEGWATLAPIVRPTLANTVPTLARRLLETDGRAMGMDRLRWLGCGGAAMPESDFHRWRERGVTVIQGYGLTEASPVVCSATPLDAVPGLVGPLVGGWQGDVRDGRLFVRGPHTMLGYLDDPGATAERVDSEGWLDTGDIVEIDPPRGQYRIVARADEVIVLPSGYKVHPGEVEQAVEQLDGVRYAMLVKQEQGLVLWVDVDPNQDWARLLNSVKLACAALPSWQRPQEIEIFSPPLTQERGELTVKGTLRRREICRRRFQRTQDVVGA